ncbi:MAG: ABC transporter permease [Gammaproteobacteria bacterium]|nr:MAG: ABC transporter permease [Gammaproteobacteria bacterium]
MIEILWTDALVFLLVIAIIGFALYARSREHLRAPWREVVKKPMGMSALIILMVYVVIGLLDSLHYRPVLENTSDNSAQTVQYAANIESVLDHLLSDMRHHTEKTYSAPLAVYQYNKETLEDESGVKRREYPRLNYAGKHLDDPASEHLSDIISFITKGTLSGLLIWLLFIAVVIAITAKRNEESMKAVMHGMWQGQRDLPWRSMLATAGFVILSISVLYSLAGNYHVFGTDKVGEDVLYQAIKSIRTGLVIGTLTTLIMLPFAILLGIAAGYFKGWVDDVIQYIYTTLNSIPGVLLIAAAVLMMLVYMETHPELFGTGVERADFRLLFLCMILGVTSWTGLCRLLRAETLKLSELEYVQAAESLGVGNMQIILRHILPNVMHIVLIAVVMDFSGLVLAEAVLSYLNIGVDPTMYSWGNMINSSRLELAREPIVWWAFIAAFIFMFLLVLSANLFSDAVRDAFDPRLREISR